MPYLAFTIGPHPFFAADCHAEMLWVLKWQELTLDSCPIRGTWCHHFRPTNRFWQPQTSLSVGPPTCNDQKWVVNELLCEFATEFQLAQQDRRRQKCKCKQCIHLLSQQVQAQTRISLPTCSLCWGILPMRLENASDFCGHQPKGAPTNMSILGMSFGAQWNSLRSCRIKNRSPKNQMNSSHCYQRIKKRVICGCDDGGREKVQRQKLERGTEHSCEQQAWLVASVGWKFLTPEALLICKGSFHRACT